MPINFFVIINSEQIGPCTMERLIELYQLGQITEATYYWREGMTEWLPLGSFVTDAIAALEKLPQKSSAPPARPPVAAPTTAAVTAKPPEEVDEPVAKNDDPAELTVDAHAVVAGRSPWGGKIFVWFTILTVLCPLAGLVVGLIGLQNPATRKQGATLVEWAIVLLFVSSLAILFLSYL